MMCPVYNKDITSGRIDVCTLAADHDGPCIRADGKAITVGEVPKEVRAVAFNQRVQYTPLATEAFGPFDIHVTVFTPWGASIGWYINERENINDVADLLHQVHEQGPCLKCGHEQCPCCVQWCDMYPFDESAPACCQGDEVCVYATTPEQRAAAPEPWHPKEQTLS